MSRYDLYRNVGHHNNAHGGTSNQRTPPQNTFGQGLFFPVLCFIDFLITISSDVSPAARQDEAIFFSPLFSFMHNAMNMDPSSSQPNQPLVSSTSASSSKKKIVPPEFGKNWGQSRRDKTDIHSILPSSSARNQPSLSATVDINQLPISQVFGIKWTPRAKKRGNGDAPGNFFPCFL
ncbi:hypothetical protein CPB84DRAFT_1790526, partial [Gymnopilus junonius]